MQGFSRSTFFKRIDSVGFSFLLTVYRHILRNCVFLYAIKNKLKLPIADENQLPDEFIEDGDINAIFDMNGALDPNGDADGLLSVPQGYTYQPSEKHNSARLPILLLSFRYLPLPASSTKTPRGAPMPLLTTPWPGPFRYETGPNLVPR